MTNDSAGRQSRGTRTALAALGVLLALSLGACTTVEGTNALTDIGTFEREVMTSTAQGLGLVPQSEKEESDSRRGPLVLPRNASSLPSPREGTLAAQLPADSDTVQIDTASLSEEDLKRLRNARVVDLRSMGGRPLTEAEAKALTARMEASNMAQKVPGQRPLYLPPDEYFTTVAGTDLICLAPGGELVSLNDDRCPRAIRDAMKRRGPTNSGVLTTNILR